MSSRAMLRASDADREAAAERLRTAAAEGRLETDELDERLHVALRARTYGELDRVLADLPSTGTPRRGTQLVPAAQSALAVAMPILTTIAVVAAVVVLAAVAAAWWICWALAWFFMCGPGARSIRRLGRGMERPRPAGLHQGYR